MRDALSLVNVRLCLCLLPCTVALSALAPAQDPQRTFRSSVQTVPIYATVLDKAGRLVPDLTENDFEVLDNGKPAPTTFFNAEVQPISVVVAIDTSGSMAPVLTAVRDAAEAFVLQLQPADRAIVVTFNDTIDIGGPFTSDRVALSRYLRTEMRYGNTARLWDALDASIVQLEPETPRKVVLVFSDSEDFGGKLKGDTVLAHAQNGHVMVYVIGMRHLSQSGRMVPSVETRPDGFLSRLASETGGSYTDNPRATELRAAVTRVADEIHQQYLMAIAPALSDGKTHKLTVRVKVPGLTARARKTYVATKVAAAEE